MGTLLNRRLYPASRRFSQCWRSPVCLFRSRGVEPTLAFFIGGWLPSSFSSLASGTEIGIDGTNFLWCRSLPRLRAPLAPLSAPKIFYQQSPSHYRFFPWVLSQ